LNYVNINADLTPIKEMPRKTTLKIVHTTVKQQDILQS